MLYIYYYPANHRFEELNAYLIHFIETAKSARPNTKFLESHFHDDFIPIVKRSSELKKKFEDFFNSFKKLDDATKAAFYTLVLKSQNIHGFFSDTSLDCCDIMREKVDLILGNQSFKILVDHLFKTTLRSFDIEGHYKLIYESMPHKVCPFCGVELMHKTFREDYDHLAAKSIYPILAIHPRNLAPMCHTCNTKNKGEKDVLHKLNGERRGMINPYSEKIDITLDYSGTIIPQTDINNQQGSWVVNVIPNNETTKNWDEVFGIKKRYIEDYIEPSFADWMDDFVRDCIWAGKDLSNLNEIVNELKTMSNSFREKWYQNSNIIKGPLFEYLSTCNNTIFYNSIMEKYNKQTAVI